MTRVENVPLNSENLSFLVRIMSRSYNDELQFLEKLNSNCWRIKKGFVPNMQVSSGIFRAPLANEAPSVSTRCTTRKL